MKPYLGSGDIIEFSLILISDSTITSVVLNMGI